MVTYKRRIGPTLDSLLVVVFHAIAHKKTPVGVTTYRGLVFPEGSLNANLREFALSHGANR